MKQLKQLKHWQDPINALLGIWLVLSPWAVGYSGVAPVVTYRPTSSSPSTLSRSASQDLVRIRVFPGVYAMIPKRILSRDRVRRPPQTGWSWVDRRFVREQADRLSRDAVLLYFFLCAVADQNGLSYYGDVTLADRLRMSATSIERRGRNCCCEI